MSKITDHLRQRADETRSELEKARAVTLEARAREESLASDLAAYEKTLAAELRRNGSESITPRVVEAVGISLPSQKIGRVNKTALAFELVEKAEPNGVTAEDLQKAFAERGMTLHRNYVFNITSRLKAQHKIGQRGNRYFVVR